MYQQYMTHIWRPLFLWDAVSFFRFCQQDFPTSLGWALSSCKLWINSYYLRVISINITLKKKWIYIRVLVQRAVCTWLTSRACGQSMSGISLKAEPRPHHGTAHSTQHRSTGAQEHTAHRLLPSPPQNSHTVKLTRGAQGDLPQAAWGAGDQWMPIHSEILPHCRHVPRADPTDFPHSFRPRAQALPFLRDRTSFLLP